MHNIDENEVLRDVLSGLNDEVPPMPENLHAAWMQKVEEDKMETTRTHRSFARFLSIAAALVFVVGGTLLTRDNLDAMLLRRQTDGAYNALVAGNSEMKYAAQSSSDYAFTLGASVEDSAEADSGAGANTLMMVRSKATANDTEAAAPAVTEKKIIRTASLTIYTKTFENSLNTLRTSCEGQGGWIESSSESVSNASGLRTAYLTLRIPQDGLDAYLDGTDALGRITSRSESAQDVTATYQDTAARLNTQLALMERLQALITSSGDLSDLLALESQIAETQYQIDSLQSALNTTDRQVSYSTVSITLREEKNAEITDTSVSFGERLLAAVSVGFASLVSFLGDMVVFLVAALPFIAIVAIILIAIRLIRKRRKSS